MARPRQPGAPPATLLGDHTGYLLHRAGYLVLQRVERVLAPLDLTGRMFFALTALQAKAPMSQQELSQLFALDPATVVAMVDEFERHGWVARERSTTDRRRYELVLTANGTKRLATALRLVTEVEEQFLAPLDARARDTMHKALTLILRDDDHA